MNADFYLVIQGKESRHVRGVVEMGAIRTTKTKPNVAADEICVKVQLQIPDALFKKPTLVASITVPDIADPIVSADFAESLSELVRESLGVTLHIQAAGQGEES